MACRVTENLENADVAALTLGDVVRISGDREIMRSLADTQAHVHGTIGVTLSSIAVGATGPVITSGEAIVRMEAGLVPAPQAGETIWVSPTTGGVGLGKATNVMPSLVWAVGIVKDASPYTSGYVIADIVPATDIGSSGLGPPGPQGASGARGATGLQGATGIQGGTGAQGFTGPQGATGLRGSTGIQGSTGPQGATGMGATGLQGATGIQGATGPTGPQGASGARGTTGFQGATGLQGGTGPQGVTGAGVTGPQGATGVGAQGATGLQGGTGPQGAAGQQGNAGAQGAAGAQGQVGQQGNQGATGLQGTTGPQGASGARGATGLQGATGHQGATGLQGATGQQGMTGSIGVQGSTGPGFQQIQYTFYSEQFLDPASSDWAAPTLAPAVVDTPNSAINVRQFDQTVEQGVGFQLPVPSGAAQVALEMIGWPDSSPGSNRSVGQKLYYRAIANGVTINSAWSSKQLNNFTLPTGTRPVYKTRQVIGLTTLGLSPGVRYQFELSRNAPTGGISSNLTGDFLLYELQVEFN